MNIIRQLVMSTEDIVPSRLFLSSFSVLVLLVLYGYSRYGRYPQVNFAFSLLGTVIVILLMLDSSDVIQSLNYLIIVTLFSQFFLSPNMMLLLATIQVVLVVLLAFLSGVVSFDALVAGPLSFLASVPIVIYLFSIHQEDWDEYRTAELEQTKERYRIISEANTDYALSFTVEKNRQLTPEWRSASFETVTGYSYKEIMTQPPLNWLVMVHSDDQQAQREQIQRAIDEKQTHESEARLITKDGELKYVRNIHHPVVDESGTVTHLYSTTQDITAQHLARQHAFELALERERIQLLRDFITQASHEFRTPLSLINSNLYLLERTDHQREERFKIIYNQTQALNNLVERLVTMVELDSGVEMKHQPVAINSVVDMVTVAYSTELKHYHMTVDLAQRLPMILGDTHYLHKALLEILKNAVQHTPVDGAITLRAYPVNAGKINLEIQDTGQGILPEDQPHIFKRFYRGDKSQTTRGFGLGLAIAQRIIEAHGGKITFETSPGKGTTFTIQLKVADQLDDATIT